MRAAKDELLRWRQTSRDRQDPRALSARAADLVDAVREVPPVPPEALARIKAYVLSRRATRAGRGLPLLLRFALLSTVVLASVATAKGTIMLWHQHVAARAAASAPARSRPAATRVHPRASVPAEPPAIIQELAPLTEPAAELPPTVVVAPPRPRRIALLAPPPRAAGNTAPATEAQLLAGALARLRQAHDPTGAVALLDQYARRFPHGVLESEALSARLEAVIQLDDRPAALRLLDGRHAFAGRLGAQQLLTRAELRASAGRYADALTDFDRLLAVAATTTSTDGERALYGRAVCLGHLGQDDRARADLTTYQRRFPDGKHAAEVARLLQGTTPSARP
ncbi:MAG TPA: tetratricopeptide repeat protein [Polyangia bacterium]|jgi:hypothetical protein